MSQTIPDWLLERQLDPKTGSGDVLVSTAGDGSPIAARIVVCRHCYASLSICRLYQLAAGKERAHRNSAHLERGTRRQHENPEKIANSRGTKDPKEPK
jgi:hypothetical protein